MKTFNRDYGVLTCPHIFRNERPVLLVVRDPDGYWQFMCGKDDAEDKEGCHLLHAGHLMSRDPSLEGMAELEVATFAERQGTDSQWTVGRL